MLQLLVITCPDLSGRHNNGWAAGDDNKGEKEDRDNFISRYSMLLSKKIKYFNFNPIHISPSPEIEIIFLFSSFI